MNHTTTIVTSTDELTVEYRKGHRVERFGPFEDAKEMNAFANGMTKLANLLRPNSTYEKLLDPTPRPNKTNTLPVGVIKSDNRYRARIRINGKHVSLGQFGTAQEARNAYLVALANKHKG